jgi:hypothetical protein
LILSCLKLLKQFLLQFLLFQHFLDELLFRVRLIWLQELLVVAVLDWIRLTVGVVVRIHDGSGLIKRGVIRVHDLGIEIRGHFVECLWKLG